MFKTCQRRADWRQSGNRRPLPLLASPYPDDHLARLRAVLLHPQKLQRRRAEILASGVMTRTDIGLLATLFYITYGLSKFFSGIVSDRSRAILWALG
jgi:hypothetical protein